MKILLSGGDFGGEVHEVDAKEGETFSIGDHLYKVVSGAQAVFAGMAATA